MPDSADPTSQTNFHGPVVGAAFDGGTVNARNIAGRDIHEHHHYPPPKPEIVFPLVHLPPGGRNPNFTGREPMLARLGAQLGQAQGTVVVSQAITGLGGVGKTQLAVEYIYRQQENPQTAYDLVWWLRADTVVNLAADMAALAAAVGSIGPDNPDQQAALNAARRWLAQTDKRWLLLVDNADDLPPRTLNPYLPDGGKGHILITSRNPNWGGLVGPEAILSLDTFTRAESLAFLHTRVRSNRFSGPKGDKSPTTNKRRGGGDGQAGGIVGRFPAGVGTCGGFYGGGADGVRRLPGVVPGKAAGSVAAGHAARPLPRDDYDDVADGL